MPDGEDFLWRPVRRGLCEYKDVMDASRGFDLEDFARMNDILDVEDENALRHQAQQRARQNG
jgi:hypothetical protein